MTFRLAPLALAVLAFVATGPITAGVAHAQSKCAGTKRKEAGKKAGRKLKCWSKAVKNGAQADPGCIGKAELVFSSKWDKAEAKGGCATTGDKTTIENKVDAFVTDTAAELPGVGVTTTTTATTTTSTTTTSPIAACCGSVRIVTKSSAGTLTVDGFAPFPFPPNVQTTIEVGAATPFPGCQHTGIVPSGGFTVPAFCIPALMYSSVVEAKGCESGGADGQAVVWDAAAAAPDPNVTRLADTSDADGGGPSCGTLGSGCNTNAGGAGADTQGNINTTRGGAPLPTGAVHTQVDIPVVSTTWSPGGTHTGQCPDSDGMYTAGTDSLVTQFAFVLSPTSGSSSATLTDLNADGCAFAGGGPASMSLVGSPAPGPCCTVGQATTVVSTGAAFTGAFPLYDITFSSTTPTTITSCTAPSSAETCTLTTDPCAD